MKQETYLKKDYSLLSNLQVNGISFQQSMKCLDLLSLYLHLMDLLLSKYPEDERFLLFQARAKNLHSQILDHNSEVLLRDLNAYYGKVIAKQE